MEWVNEALELALQAIDCEHPDYKSSQSTNKIVIANNMINQQLKLNNDIIQNNSNEIIRNTSEPIYENINEIVLEDTPKARQRQLKPDHNAVILQKPISVNNINHNNHNNNNNNKQSVLIKESHENNDENFDEPYYQVPKSSEPYYEVPKYIKPVPVYENIEIFFPGSVNAGINNVNYPMGGPNVMEPPKEKPPPPPIDNLTDDDDGDNDVKYERMIRKSQVSSGLSSTNLKQQKPKELQNGIVQPIKRMNSTKRIKKELRNKRSSFLGIEGTTDDDSFLELTVAPPPDMAQLLQEERRLEKQLYMKAGLYESSDTGESRDSGVSENHSRQSSEPFTNSSEEHEDLLVQKEKEIIEVLSKEEEKRRAIVDNWPGGNGNDDKMQCIEDQIREQEEVLRVERELLQLEQEELKRQRENLMIRENLARHELQHGAKMLMSANRHSLQDINNASVSHYANIPNQIYQIETDYRKSMSDLQDFSQKRLPPTPPAKPLRSNLNIDQIRHSANINNNGLVKIATNHTIVPTNDEFVPLRNYQTPSSGNIHHGNMTRHTLHALSATPKPKFTDGWVSAKKSPEKFNDSWLSYQQKRKSVPEGFNYNKHWLIQEAEQRRIEQQRGIRNSSSINGWNTNSSIIQRNGITDNKPLPDSVIQTLTQRVQNKCVGDRRRLDASNESIATSTTPTSPKSTVAVPQLNPALPDGQQQQEKILSVSGKKKCSHCGEELGRGAAMIIESLRLFYHIDCFKCCVCHVQLGDGLNGTDVRVRNHKLHCHNCYSSDDGIKFSCV